MKQAFNKLLAMIAFIACSTLPSPLLAIENGAKPPKPQISDVSFSYIFNWETNSVWPNGVLTFSVKSEGATCFRLRYNDQIMFSPPPIHLFMFCTDFEGEDEVRIEWNTDWGEYLLVTAYNKYGFSLPSEMIYTTDYITDPDVLQKIEEIKNQAGILQSNTDTTDISATWDNNTLTFNHPMDKVFVYNIAGNQILAGTNTQSLSLSHLPAGSYIIVYNSYNTTRHPSATIKIIKQ